LANLKFLPHDPYVGRLAAEGEEVMS
jgi:hypothetical protein